MIVLSEIELCEEDINGIFEVKVVKRNDLVKFEGNMNVVAIVGCRSSIIQVSKMNFPSLKMVHLTSAGVDNVPVLEYESKSVLVRQAKDVYSIPIAETIVYSLLRVEKRYRLNFKSTRLKFTRNYNTINEMYGKRAITLGAGSIAREVAKRISAFGVEIDGYDPYVCECNNFQNIINNREKLLEELYSYDYVISTLPDTQETKGFVNVDLLEKMNPASIFVNVGRRSALSEEALYKVLNRKAIKGAILDMFEVIPNPITNRFRRLSNVIVLPGVAAISVNSKRRLKCLVASNIVRDLQNFI